MLFRHDHSLWNSIEEYSAACFSFKTYSEASSRACHGLVWSREMRQCNAAVQCNAMKASECLRKACGGEKDLINRRAKYNLSDLLFWASFASLGEEKQWWLRAFRKCQRSSLQSRKLRCKDHFMFEFYWPFYTCCTVYYYVSFSP